MKKKKIRDRLHDILGLTLEKVEVTRERTIDSVGRIAYGVEPAPKGDKVRAQVCLMKYHGLLIDKMEMSGPGGGPIEIEHSLDDLSDDELAQVKATAVFLERKKKAAEEEADNPGVE